MKLLHTADWHIGQSFYDFSRRTEHLLFLEWLKEQIATCEVDALFISGDVFDTPNPSADAQKILYKFLKEVTVAHPELQVVIIAGNHDSAARLEAPNPLLEEMNISVRGVVKRTSTGEIDYQHLLVPLRKGGDVVAWCLAVPYLRQGDYPEAESYPLGVKAMYDSLMEEVEKVRLPHQAVVAMGHLHTAGGIVSENDRAERTVVGGVECVAPDAFSTEIAYLALGHLHRSQQVGGREEVRYSGAPLPMSFAERNNKQGVVLVKIEDRKATKIDRLLFDAPIQLLSIPKVAMPLNEVMEEIALLPEGERNEFSPFLEVKVLITEPEPSLRHQIEKALEDKDVRLVRLEAVTPKGERDERVMTYEELQTISPMEIAKMEYEKVFGGTEMPQTMKVLLESVIREVENENISN